MACGEDFIDALKREHDRLGQLLQTIDSGRWWTDDEPGHEKVAALQERVAQIRACLDGIERVVGGIGM